MTQWPLVSIALSLALLAGAAAFTMPHGERQLVAWDEGPAGLADARRAVEAMPQVAGVASLVATPGALDAVADAKRTLVVVAGAERAYTADEVDALADFQARGGALFVLDKDADTSRLVARYGVDIDGREVLSPDAVGPFVAVEAATEAGGPRGLAIALFRPTSLGLRPNWTGGAVAVLANTSSDAVIDVDGNGNITPEVDIAAAFPLVVLSTPNEGGPVAVVADPVAFTNQGLATDDNRAFLVALVGTLLPDGGTVVFDEARHAQAGGYPLELVRLATLVAQSLAGVALVVALVGGLVWVARRHEGLDTFGHLYAPATVVEAPRDEAGARAMLAGEDDEGA